MRIAKIHFPLRLTLKTLSIALATLAVAPTARANAMLGCYPSTSPRPIPPTLPAPDTVIGSLLISGDTLVGITPSTNPAVDTGTSITDAQPDSLGSAAVRFADSAMISPSTHAYSDSIFPIEGHILNRLPLLDSILRTSHWHTDLTTGFDRLVPIDSSLRYVHLYDPTLGGPHNRTHLGIDYAASLRKEFAARPNALSPIPLFAHSIIELLPLATGTDTYSSRGPFSQVLLMSNFSTRTEQIAGRLFYTQNVTPSTNLGLAFDHGDETGAYTNFQTRVNALRIFGSYAAKRIYCNLSVGFAKHTMKDYGGLANDNDQLSPELKRQETPVRLSTPSARISSQAASAIFEFDILQYKNVVRDSLGIQYTAKAPLLSLTSTHHFRAYYRGYHEAYSLDELRPRYISSTAAIDSVGQQSYSATVGARLRQLKHARLPLPGIRAAVGYQLDRYIMPRPNQYLTGEISDMRHSLFVVVGADYALPHLNVAAFAQSYLLGGKLGNTKVKAEVSYFPAKREKQYEIRAEWQGDFASQHPFYMNYRSNRFVWNNTEFKRSFSSVLGAAFVAPKWGGEYGVNNVITTNYTYIDSAVRPAQLPKLNVLEVYIQQTFDRWGLSAVLRGSWQHASHHAAAVPTITVYGNLAYQFPVIKNALSIRLGAEAYYYSLYFAPGYCTDLGVFYAQRDMKIGNYPMLNAFLSLKWKSANIFVKVFNVAQGAYGYDFFAAPHYPDRRRSVRLGINWYFYN